MDKVRLGRALGYGTRHLGKTLIAVAEASTATSTPAPSPPEAPAQPPEARSRPRSGEVTILQPHPDPATGHRTGGQPRRQTRSSLKRSFWQPLATYSGALWLRVTGTFFALLASTMLTAAWRLRSDLHLPAGPSAAHHLWIFTSFGILFAYFAVSSFVRASQKERNPGG